MQNKEISSYYFYSSIFGIFGTVKNIDYKLSLLQLL